MLGRVDEEVAVFVFRPDKQRRPFGDPNCSRAPRSGQQNLVLLPQVLDTWSIRGARRAPHGARRRINLDGWIEATPGEWGEGPAHVGLVRKREGTFCVRACFDTHWYYSAQR